MRDNLEDILKKLNARYREADEPPLLVRYGEHPEFFRVSFIPTNVPEVNEALGGGIPRGCMMTITGAEGAGKTALALSAAKWLIDQGEEVLYIGTEGAFPEVVAEAVGLKKESLLVLLPLDFGEQIVDTVEELLFDKERRKLRKCLSLIILDSVNGIIPKEVVEKAEKEGASARNVAARARLLSQFTERIHGRGLLMAGATFIMTAQRRTNISVYGAPTQMSGGLGIRYNSKIILNLSKTVLKSKESGRFKVIGHRVDFTVEKNSISGVPRSGSYTVMYGAGVDDSLYLADLAIEKGIIVKKGRSEYVLPGMSSGGGEGGGGGTNGEGVFVRGGRAALIDYLRSAPDYRVFLRSLIFPADVDVDVDMETEEVDG